MFLATLLSAQATLLGMCSKDKSDNKKRTGQKDDAHKKDPVTYKDFYRWEDNEP